MKNIYILFFYVCGRLKNLIALATGKNKNKQTPLMSQYFEMKAQHRDALLLFRVGDFYETFGKDAVEASNILGIVLTKRNNGGSNIELAGFPHHSLDLYLPKLVKAGKRVAICEQLEKPRPDKKVVKRGVTELVSPGIHQHENLLSKSQNNFIGAVHIEPGKPVGLALLDISTGEFLCYEGNSDKIRNLLKSLSPSEMLYPHSREKQTNRLIESNTYLYPLEDWIFTYEFGRDKLLEYFKLKTLKGFGIEEARSAQVASGAIIHYLEESRQSNTQQIQKITPIGEDGYLWLDRFTIRNLELVEPLVSNGTTLLDVMDFTVSPMGSRLLRKWILFPLTDLEKIKARQEVVQILKRDGEMREQIRAYIKDTGDLERLASKIPNARITPRQLYHLGDSIASVQKVKQLLLKCASDGSFLTKLAEQIHLLPELEKDIKSTLHEEPPSVIGKGYLIKRGKNKELDELRDLRQNSKDILLEIQQRESELTGIKSLKIGYNNVFGYYLEVTNKYKDQGMVPDTWIRKQTLTNSERYITEELKELEQKILSAEEKITAIESDEWEALLNRTIGHLPHLLANARALAKIDVLSGFAVLALERNYVTPICHGGFDLHISEGRHPVIEVELPAGQSYIPNDVTLDAESQQIIIITGPNMSGKSALLRQVALISIMAQTGSCVPAREASIGLLDRIFTRVGASDNISSGESTFMVEMNETASILNNLSSRSLVILDEIGRGTSTFDGISIAWSIAEFLHKNEEERPRSLFATHYHELNELADHFPRIHNYHISTKQVGHQVIFLRKLLAGGVSHSFGIHVAKMAGMPPKVVRRAQEILHILEEKSASSPLGDNDGMDELPLVSSSQLDMFSPGLDPAQEEVLKRIQHTDLNTLTPIDCMLLVKHLQEKLVENTVSIK